MGQKPPFIFSVLRFIIPGYDRDPLFDELCDFYESINAEKGSRAANLWLSGELLRSLPGFCSAYIYWRYSMARSYVKLAVRNIKKQMLYSIINIAGLALGLTCSLLIFLYIQDEVRYDRYHERAEQLYRVTMREEIGGRTDHFAGVPFGAAQTFAAELPEIIRLQRLVFSADAAVLAKQTHELPRLLHADTCFFKDFTHSFLYGDPATALNQPGSIILTRSTAKRVFGLINPINRTIHLEHEGDALITAIIEDVPKNSHFTFDAIISNYRLRTQQPGRFHSWFGIIGWAYILVENGTNPRQLEAKFSAIAESRIGQALKVGNIKTTYPLQKLTDIHLKSRLQFEMAANGDIRLVYFFSAMAVLVLAVACFNFINLSTARYNQRAKEAGIRKLIGAVRKQLISQFIIESFILCFLALMLAIILILLSLPLFNQLTGKTFGWELFEQKIFWLGLMCILFLTALLAGTYPAIFLSSFHPLAILRQEHLDARRGIITRHTLVIVQFCVSIALIFCTFVISDQLRYMKNAELGFNREHILVLPVPKGTLQTNYRAFKEEIYTNPRIQRACYSDEIPGKTRNVLTFRTVGQSAVETIALQVINSDYDFIDTYGLDIVAGRSFDPDLRTDAGTCLINETAARSMDANLNVLGKQIRHSQNAPVQIIGIVKDFNYQSLKHSIDPLVILCTPRVGEFHYERYLSIRIHPEDIRETVQFVALKYRRFTQGRPFDYFFIDALFHSLYQSEERTVKMVFIFAGLAIFIACLGLMGLISFAAERRSKEIGIRKSLGATPSAIFLLLARDYLYIIALANIIALPLAYIFIKHFWLQNFYHQVHPRPILFVLAAVISICITFFTISYQSIKAAQISPVKALRYE
ncbi:ABC transporter permease [candidate division KSB1 bacterium]|nr:ABC transporter permease [candidate division KSB1 bacterium]